MPSFVEIGYAVPEKKIFEGFFTIYGHGSHLDHVTWIIYIYKYTCMFTPYIRLVKFQLVRQIPDVYVSECVLAGKLFCCIFHTIPKLFMI